MEEAWRVIPGARTYEVSDLGRVRRAVASPTYPGRYPAGRLLKTTLDTDGYPILTLLWDDGLRKTVAVHKLVARAFLGPCPEGHEVNHIGPSGDRTDNRLSNLEYVTPSQNQKHAFRVLGKINSQAKLSPERVVELRERRAHGERVKDLAEEFDLWPAIVGRIASGELWPLVGGPRTAPRRLGPTNRDVQARVSNEKVLEIVARRKAGESPAALGLEFGVSRQAIHLWTKNGGRAGAPERSQH